MQDIMKASHFFLLVLVNKMCSHEDEHFCFVTFSLVSCILHLTFYVNGSCVTWAVFLWNELITSPIQLPFYRFSDLYMSRVTNLSRYSLNQVGIYQWECLNIVNNFVLLTPLSYSSHSTPAEECCPTSSSPGSSDPEQVSGDWSRDGSRAKVQRGSVSRNVTNPVLWKLSSVTQCCEAKLWNCDACYL